MRSNFLGSVTGVAVAGALLGLVGASTVDIGRASADSVVRLPCKSSANCKPRLLRPAEHNPKRVHSPPPAPHPVTRLTHPVKKQPVKKQKANWHKA